VDTPVEAAQSVVQDAQVLTDTYHEAVAHTEDVAVAHVNGLKAVWEKAVAETHKLRDELASAIAGSDVEAMRLHIADLEAQVEKLKSPVVDTPV